MGVAWRMLELLRKSNNLYLANSNVYMGVGILYQFRDSR